MSMNKLATAITFNYKLFKNKVNEIPGIDSLNKSFFCICIYNADTNRRRI